jgi:hypothetical protein
VTTEGLFHVGPVVVVAGPAARAAFNAMCIAIRNRAMSGLPDSRTYLQLAEAFGTAAKSPTRQPDVAEEPVVQVFPTVTTRELAQQLGIGERQAQRLAPRLGGRRIAGRWLCDQQAIDEHLEGLTHGPT